jgi:putative sterol carrier protein
MTRRVSNHTEEFFERIVATPQPLLHDVEATIRIDLADDHETALSRMMRIDHGRVRISAAAGRADATIRTDRAIFEHIVSGEANALTAALRGRVRIDGDLRLLVVFVRLVSRPPAPPTMVPTSDRTAKEAARTVKASGTASRTGRVSAAAARTARKDRAR